MKLESKHDLQNAPRQQLSLPKKTGAGRGLSPKELKAMERSPIRQKVNVKSELKTTHPPAKRQKLLEELKHTNEGRGSMTRGWQADQPQKGKKNDTCCGQNAAKNVFCDHQKVFPFAQKTRGNARLIAEVSKPQKYVLRNSNTMMS